MEPHKSLYKALNEAKDSVDIMTPYSEQSDQENITLSLHAVKQFVRFSMNTSKKVWKDVQIGFSALNLSNEHLKKSGNPPLLLQMQKVQKVILNNYHWRCVPPTELQVEAQHLEITLYNYIWKTQIESCKVESTSSLGKKSSSSIPNKNRNTNHGSWKTKIENFQFSGEIESESSSSEKSSNTSTPKTNRTLHDTAILNLLERAINMSNNVKLLVPEVSMQNFISDFAYSIEVYLIYCETGSKYFYQTCAVAFEDLPCVNIKQNIPITTLHNLLLKIANLIIYSYPKYHSPPKPVIEQLRGFLRVLDRMEKCWKGTTESNQCVLDYMFTFIFTKINNLILKSFSGLAPSEPMQTVVTSLIDALDSYIPCFSSVTKHNWDYTKKMFSKVGECNIEETNRAEMNLLELIKTIAVVSHYKYIPPAQVQSKFIALNVTLDEWKAQWNTKKTNSTGKPSEKTKEPTTNKNNNVGVSSKCMKKDNENLVNLLRKVRSEVDNYSGLPDRDLQTEMFETVRHLQKCNADWEKRSSSILKIDPQSTRQILEPILAVPSNVTSTSLLSLNKIAKEMSKTSNIVIDRKAKPLKNGGFIHYQPTFPVYQPTGFPPYQPTYQSMNHMRKERQPSFEKRKRANSIVPAKRRRSKRSKNKNVAMKENDSGTSKTNVFTEQKPHNSHVMMTRSKTRAEETSETDVEGKRTTCEESKNLYSNKNEGIAKYSKKLVTTVSCLNSTINCFVFDEISLTKVQIQNLKSAIGKLSSSDKTEISDTLTKLFEQVKNANMLAQSTIIDINILIKRFKAKLLGDETIIENIVQDSFNENYDDVKNGNESYLERCASYDGAIENLVGKKIKASGLLEFTENANDLINAGSHEVYDELNEHSIPNETLISNDLERLNDTVELCEESVFNDTLQSNSQSVVNETIESIVYDDDDDSCSDSDCEENPNCFRIFRDGGVLVVELNEDTIDYNAVFSVIIHQPTYHVIDLTNRKLFKYDAYMLLPDDEVHSRDDENKLKLEFPNVETFVKFVHENEDLVRRLKLVSKDSDEVETINRKLQDVPKLLNEQCKGFIRTKESIDQQVEHELKVFAACMQSTMIKEKVLHDLSIELYSVFSPSSKLHVFGSRASGQASPDSDFDIYCDVMGQDYFRGVPYEKQKNYVSKLGARLRKNSGTFSKILSLTRTRVPIVKLFHKPTGMNCDISFKDGTSVENTALLKVYLDMDTRVRWVLTAVKLWANYNQVTGSHYFTSHGLTWLVLFYLMDVKLIPPVIELQMNCQPKIINDWNVAFKKPIRRESEMQASSLELFKGFFSWIVDTDLTAVCLCTITGEAIPKTSFQNINWMKRYRNGVFRTYAERLDIGKAKRRFQISSYDTIEMNGRSGLCVQDPFEFCKNVVKYVTNSKYETFLKFCKETNTILNTIR